jgi:ElaB/YqjD/DUF883 family membrane-anchored ribosome-binding protein
MPHTRDHKGAVDGRTSSDTQTQQSSYTPASDIPVEESTDSTVDSVKEKARDTAEMAKDRADEGIDKAAEGMQGAADKLRDRAEQQGGVAADAGVKVADTMERSAEYLREHDTDQIFEDLEQYVRKHPMQAIAGAVVGGFIVGRLLG